MDNYKRYLFDSQFQGNEASQKIFSFGGSIVPDLQENPSQKGEFANYLDSNSHPDNQQDLGFDDEYKKDFLRSQIKSLREKLIVMGFPAIGDLFSGQNGEVQTTVKALFAIIQQRKQDMDFRNTIHDRIAKVENEKTVLGQNLDRVGGQKKTLEQELLALQNKLKGQEKASKEQISKLVQEKDELQKQYLKIQNMKSQYEHEIKQRDLNVQKLQEHLKKAQGQKSLQFKNAFEISSQLEQSGPNLFSANGEFEFSQMAMKRWEEINKRLQQENEVLKENLIRIHNELNEILSIRKEVFLKRRKIDYGEEYMQNIPMELERPEQSMIQFKQDLFKTPLENNCKEAIQLLQDNLAHFKELMKKFDQQYEISVHDEDINIDGDVQELGKIRACKNLSELFKNYNHIFETQDKMINQIIGKSQGLKKLDELNYNINRFNRVLDDKQIEDVRRYLQEQKTYLDESKNEMDIIKKQFSSQLKKKEEEKQLISAKRHQLEDANEKFKENIRLLQNASKQAIQNLIQNEEYNEKKILQESNENQY